MAGFVVDTDSLIDVANSLQTLSHVLNSIPGEYVSCGDADIGGRALGDQVTTFNDQWMYGVTEITGEVESMTLALLEAAAHYDQAEQQITNRSHDTPQGSGPVVAGHHFTAPAVPTPATPRHARPHNPRHAHPKPAPHHHKGHEQGGGTGTTTIGAPRMPVTGTGTGTGTGTTTIGGGDGNGHHVHKTRSGTATITIGPGGTTVLTGPGQGHGTTVIDGDIDATTTTAATSTPPARQADATTTA